MDFFSGGMSPVYLLIIMAIQAYKVYRDHKAKPSALEELLAAVRQLLTPPPPPPGPAVPNGPPADPNILQANVPVQFRVTPNVTPVFPPGP